MNPSISPPNLGSNVFLALRTYLRAYPAWGFSPPRVQATRKLQKFGSDYGGYHVDESMIHPAAVIYSLGIGEDISFDLALIEKLGATVEAFDPTPKVKEWLFKQALPPQFHFHPFGIAGHDGEETFYLPPRNDWVSHSIVKARQYGRESVNFPVMTLSSAMKQQEHDHIDVLKMDIEGAEYAVIEEIVRESIPVGQILVEFHHQLSSVGTSATRRALAGLERRGMKISYVCPRKEVFTLVRSA